MSTLYHDVLADLLDRHAPQCNVSKPYRPTTPWFNSACRAMKRKTRCYERIYRRTGLLSDRNNWISQLRSGQSFYRTAQDLFWKTSVENSSGNARKLWNTLSSIMGDKKRSPIIDSLHADTFLQAFVAKVIDVRASTAGSDPTEYSKFVGSRLNQLSEISLEDTVCLTCE